MKGRMMKQLVRVTGRNGVVYEERMTQEQIRQFLCLTEVNICLGVAFGEWEVTIQETPDEYEQADVPVHCSTSTDVCPVYALGRRPKGIV
jgi:hypothetical protein